MLELPYSFHIGNDKNKTKKAKQNNNFTSYNNNAIQNGIQLSKVNHHNLRQYDNNQELIKILYGSDDIVKDVKELYLKEFEESRIEYNSKQIREDRKIDNYFNKISKDTKHDLAVEIIIELGDMEYWKDNEDKHKMIDVYNEQVLYLKELVPDFKVANATIHFDEASPHLHIVGVAVKENCKTGMKKQVGKCSVFTKDNLPKIQDKMRGRCINSFNKVYGLNAVLKEKQKGRNIDYRVNQMEDYNELKKNYNKQRQKINKLNNQTNKLNTKSEEIKDIISNLKNQPLSKNNLLLSNKNKDLILDYIEEVNKSNNDFKDITNYSLSVDKIKEDFEENHNYIDELNKEIKNQNNEIRNLKFELDEKEEEISTLKTKITELKEKIEYWKEKFEKIIDYISDKVQGLFGDKDKEKYEDIAKDLYMNDIIDKKEYNKINGEKEKDDFYR
jgi:hypothetical protein